MDEWPVKADGDNVMEQSEGVCSRFPSGVEGKTGFRQARVNHCNNRALKW